MDINKLKNKNICLIRGSFIGVLILIISLLWMNIFHPKTFVQNKTDNSGSFLKAIVEVNKAQRWKPLIPRKQEKGHAPVSLLKNVVIYDKNKSSLGYNLFISSNTLGATLMDMDGKTIHQWRFDFTFLPVIAQGYHGQYWANARILKNGDLLALVPFSGLLKIDKKSNLIWFTKIICHHDFDIDSNGNIYTFTVKNSESGDTAGLMVDSITILSPNGKIKKEISLYDLFKKYPDPAYINKINKWGRGRDSKAYLAYDVHVHLTGDAFHCNALQVLDGKWASKIPAFKKGNVLINIRNLGVIICVDPDKEEIVWLMDKAFWSMGQHFAKLLDNGNILIFDNLYRPDLSRVVEFDPAAKKIVWDYSGENGWFFSLYLGQCYRLPNGNTLITESFNGHSFEVTPDKKIVWEFYNPNQADTGRYNKLISITKQMQRIPIDSALDWLKN